MKLRLRIANDVDTSKVFSASLRGGLRGYTDAVAVESHSNDVCPCIKTINGFTVIVEPYDRQQTDTDDRTRQTAD